MMRSQKKLKKKLPMMKPGEHLESIQVVLLAVTTAKIIEKEKKEL